MVDGLNAEKSALRLLVKEKRNSFTEKELIKTSNDILKKVEKSLPFQNAKNILAYWSAPGEVVTRDFILKWHEKKNFYLPVVNGNDLDVKIFNGEKYLVTGKSFGIKEPVGEGLADLSVIDLVIVPGVAFDSNNNRMGYGKGYYDRLLPKIEAKKIGICFSFQLFEKIPVNKDDFVLDMIITS